MSKDITDQNPNLPESKIKESLESRRERARKNRAIKNKGPLYIPQDQLNPDFVHRIVNDIDNGSRVQQMLDLGYEFVSKDDMTIGANDITKPSSQGTNVSRAVGDGVNAFLMRVPKEIYEDGLIEKEAETKRSTKARLTDRAGLLPGTLTQSKDK